MRYSYSDFNFDLIVFSATSINRNVLGGISVLSIVFFLFVAILEALGSNAKGAKGYKDNCAVLPRTQSWQGTVLGIIKMRCSEICIIQ